MCLQEAFSLLMFKGSLCWLREMLEVTLLHFSFQTRVRFAPRSRLLPFLKFTVEQREREREFYFKSHISLWEHSSHFRLIGRGVPSVSVVLS